MASRMFFDPIVGLRALPLVSSTCTLLFGWDQTFFLGLLNRPETRQASKPLLPSYFARFFKAGAPFVVSLIAVSFWSGIANLVVRRSVLESRASWTWYLAGTVGALGHLLYVPWVAPPIRDIIEAKEDTDPNERLDSWIRINTIRTLTVDLAAWVSFVIAVGKALE